MASDSSKGKPAGVNTVMLFGATGMIGQGILKECLKDPKVEKVLLFVRKGSGIVHDKITEVIHDDFLNFTPVADHFKKVDACFWSLGISSTAVDDATYKVITHDYTMAAANCLNENNPNMTFIFVSGVGADRDSSINWAKVKAQTEDDIVAMPFHGYAFRPSLVRAMDGETSRTGLYRWGYTLMKPFIPLLASLAPDYMTTSEGIGISFLDIAKYGTEKKILEPKDLNEVEAVARARDANSL